MQCVAIFKGCKNDNLQLFYLYFLIFAKLVDRGYAFEPPY